MVCYDSTRPIYLETICVHLDVAQIWVVDIASPVYYLPSLGAGLGWHRTSLAILWEFEADVIHIPEHIVKILNKDI